MPSTPIISSSQVQGTRFEKWGARLLATSAWRLATWNFATALSKIRSIREIRGYKVVLSTCDSQLSISLMSVFMCSLKWSRIVSIAVCARVKALGSSGCGFLVLGLFASNLPLPTFDSVPHPQNPRLKKTPSNFRLPTLCLRLETAIFQSKIATWNE